MELFEVETSVACPGVAEVTTARSCSIDVPGNEPDARWVAMAGSPRESRCSIWWRNTPLLANHRVGLIGHYAAGDDETAATLLAHVCRELRRRDCDVAVGPMDGSTWGQYRFVTEFGDEAPFWLEPANPPAWPRHFVCAGLTPLAEYFSAMNTRLNYQHRGLEQATRRLQAAGVRLRPVREHTFEDDLRKIYGVARVAFRDHLLYSEPNEASFVAQMLPLREFAALDLSWIAEHHDRPVGFLFAVPDLHEDSRAARGSAVVIKTLAVLPGLAYAGLGQWLLAHVQQHAARLGYARAIHALMRDIPPMRRLSGRYAQPIRRYTLFAKDLRDECR